MCSSLVHLRIGSRTYKSESKAALHSAKRAAFGERRFVQSILTVVTQTSEESLSLSTRTSSLSHFLRSSLAHTFWRAPHFACSRLLCPTFYTRRFASSCGGSLTSSTNAFRRRKDQAIRLRGVCRKVGSRFLNPSSCLTLSFAFPLQAHPFSTEPAGAGLGVVKAFYLTTRH